MTGLPRHLELLEADLVKAARTRARQLRRRRLVAQVIVAVAVLLGLTGAGLAAGGVLQGWLSGGDAASEARFSIDPSRTYHGPAPRFLHCGTAGAPELDCRSGQRPGELAYQLLMRVAEPPRLDRATLRAELQAVQAGSIDPAPIDQLLSDLDSVPDDFFAGLAVLARLASVGYAPDWGGANTAPAPGVPLLLACEEEQGAALRCRDLAGAPDVPVNSPVYGLLRPFGWVPLSPVGQSGTIPVAPPAETVVQDGGSSFELLLQGVFGRPLSPAERRLLIAIVTSAGSAGSGTSSPAG